MVFIHKDGKDKSFGSVKIVLYHKEIVPILSELIRDMPIKSKSRNRIILESKDYRAVISCASIEGGNQWLLTAFE